MINRFVAYALMVFAFCCSQTLNAQSSVFTYQGALNVNGSPANGSYDLKFELFDDPTAGNLLGTDQTLTGVVITNGLFTVSLDFGYAFNGSGRWLQVSAQTNGGSEYTMLTPRQKVTPTPASLHAEHSSSADSAAYAAAAGSVGYATNAAAAATAAYADAAGNATSASNAASATYAVTAGSAANAAYATNAGYAGIAGSANSIAATNIAGTIPDAKLSTNVVLRNQPAFFGSAVTATQFSGDGSSLTNMFLSSLFDVATNGTSYLQTNVYGAAGTYNFTVPSNISRIMVKLWGAGGGGAGAGAGQGGGGAFVERTLAVRSGETYTVVVGQYGGSFVAGGAGTGGEGSNDAEGGRASYAGHGGQASSLFKLANSFYIMKAVAGGGGGAYAQSGGAGGSPGQPGDFSAGQNGGGGGGGNGFGGSNGGQNYSVNALTVGETNLNLMGGNGGAGTFSGPGGGGGYGGGGGGQNQGGGGGGGSYGDIIMGGNGITPGNTADPFYVAPAGSGGVPPYKDGKDGRVVVLFGIPNYTLAAGVTFQGVLSGNRGLSGDGRDVTNVTAVAGNGAFTGTFSGTVTGSVSGSISGTVSGDGGGLTNLNASKLSSGIASDSVLSTNIPRLNSNTVFTGNLSAPTFNATNISAGSITGTNFSGNGSGLTNVPWVIKWNVVSGTSQTAVGNNGYLLTNNSPVTITLPSSPNIGEIVRIASTGSGGWKLAQNAGQRIFSSSLGGQFGVIWNPSVTTGSFSKTAGSGDAMRLVAVNGQQIATSSDGGMNWISQTLSISSPQAVASSIDGIRLIVVAAPSGFSDQGGILRSTNSGSTWSSATQSGNDWRCVCSSDNGTLLYAGMTGGLMFSSDSGANWTSTDVSGNVSALACSADGTRALAGVPGGNLYVSTDSGANWTARDSIRNWTSVASSADGLKLVASDFGGRVYTSVDGGTNWTQRLINQNWTSVASSSDGNRLLAVSSTSLYTSVDAGVTWTLRDSTRSWISCISSKDGAALVATTSTRVYRSTPFSVQTTTTGTAGGLTGPQYGAIELQHIGAGVFLPLSYTGIFEVK